ncbi:MAG: rhomboid family intramembrane serine protease [Terriglobales bacterium]
MNSPAEVREHPVEVGPKLPTPYVTYALAGICVAVFVAMVVQGVSPTRPSVGQLRSWGATFAPLTFGGQPWRLLTSIFLHVGVLHLVFNMWCLWDLGQLAELVFGRAALAALFLMSGVAGALASAAWHPMVTGGGASGAIFGVAGALIAVFYLGHMAGQAAFKSTLRSLLGFAGYNLFFGAISPHIDNAAHIGGLASGLLMGAALVWMRRRTPFPVSHSPFPEATSVKDGQMWDTTTPVSVSGSPFPATTTGRRIEFTVFAAFALVLLLAGVFVAQRSQFAIHAQRGEAALEANRPDVAIAELKEALKAKPNYPYGHWLLAQAYLRRNDYANAAEVLRKVVERKPDFAEARFRLGMALLMDSRLDEAEAQFTELQKRYPQDPNAFTGFGLLATAKGDYEAALQAYRRAAELQPGSAEAQYNLGLAAMQAKQYDEAVHAFERAVKLDPESERAKERLEQAKASRDRVIR